MCYNDPQADKLEEFAEAKLETLLDGQAWGFLVGKAVDKAAAGAFNYFMIRRLGRATKRLLQPMQD